MPAKGNKHYGYLLDDPQVNRWYENVARGSRITADVYLRRFGTVVEEKNLSPHGLLKVGQSDLFNLLAPLGHSARENAPRSRMTKVVCSTLNIESVRNGQEVSIR